MFFPLYASLRLLVPPFQFMAASMLQVLRKQDVLNYWKVAEFVSLVMDMVPELLMYKHRIQLILGLRARVGTGGGYQAFISKNFFMMECPKSRLVYILPFFVGFLLLRLYVHSKHLLLLARQKAFLQFNLGGFSVVNLYMSLSFFYAFIAV
uniref:TERF1-interacting nuclear factor 2 N-terminal domain-containing protein n=1 Tax=Gasterosteus aculeatus aculeatus TaxID=481459 RepID=A0AAQ4P3E8_GASAC